ncbi:MAG TPA: hypothetical protein VF257_18090 [Solirubrobacteraceae bacterium]
MGRVGQVSGPGTEAEDLRTARLRLDVDLLGERVIGAIDWLASHLPRSPTR